MEWCISGVGRSLLWQWVGWSVTLFGELQPNPRQFMTLTHRDASDLCQLMEVTPLAL